MSAIWIYDKEMNLVTEEQFRQALSEIVAGLSNPLRVMPQILIAIAYLWQNFTPNYPTGSVSLASGNQAIETDSGVEFRAFCQALGVSIEENDISPKAVTPDSSISAAGGLGAVIAIALAKRALTALAEKIEDPAIREAILKLLAFLG